MMVFFPILLIYHLISSSVSQSTISSHFKLKKVQERLTSQISSSIYHLLSTLPHDDEMVVNDETDGDMVNDEMTDEMKRERSKEKVRDLWRNGHRRSSFKQNLIKNLKQKQKERDGDDGKKMTENEMKIEIDQQLKLYDEKIQKEEEEEERKKNQNIEMVNDEMVQGDDGYFYHKMVENENHDEIDEIIDDHDEIGGVGVVVEASHLCMKIRGVHQVRDFY